MTDLSNFPTNKEDEALRVFLAALEAVSHIPDGKEIIGRGHIICHNAWFEKRAEHLSFSKAAKLYCPGKVKDAAITVWNGLEATTYTSSGVLSEEQAERLGEDLNQWFKGEGIESQSIAIK